MHPSDLEETIFHTALQARDPAERIAYLDHACAGDASLRQRVERLLRAGEQAREYFAQHASDQRLGSENAETTVHSPPQETAGERIGRYKLLDALGEGGFGAVWLAEQKEPVRRKVALKVIRLGMDTKQVVARFEAERQALALMDHPNIAKVLDAGTTESGRPYFVMELVRGTAITKFCDENKLTTRERLNLFIKVCQAVQHAHQKGIIHRDLKPSNVLVTLHDGVPVPKVIDFGIAKATQQELTDKTVHTQFQLFIGTPAYVSPEQAEMSGLDVDTRSDIYSLGVLLYELLTGKTPFDGKELLASGLDEMRRTIREKEPVRPSTKLSQTLVAANVSSLKSPDGRLGTEEESRASSRRLLRVKETIALLRGDLDWIVMKCLEKDRTRRYETANGLARDVERHLHQEPVVARPPSTAYRIQKFVRRNQPAVIAIAAVAAALVLGAVLSLWQAVEARTARQDALYHLYIANLNLAQQDYEQGNLRRMRRLLEESRNHPRRGFEWYYWQRRIHQEVRTFRGHTGPLRGVALSPDGRFAATASAEDVRDPNGKLWDIATGRELASFTLPLECRAVVFSPDSQRLAVGGSDGRMILWDIAARREVFTLTNRFNAPVWGLAYSSDGQRIAIGLFQAPAVLIADVVTGQVLKELSDGNTNNVPSLAFSSDGSRLATAEATGAAHLWELPGGRLLHRLDAGGGYLWQLGFDPTGERLVTAHWDGVARVWNVETGAVEKFLEGHTQPLQCALFSSDGNRIYTAGWDEQIRIWHGATGKELGQLPKGHSHGITSLALARDDRYVLTGSWDGEAKLWDAAQLDEPLTSRAAYWPEEPDGFFRFFAGLRGPHVFLSPTANAGLFLALAPTNLLVVSDFATQREILRIPTGHRGHVSAFVVAPDLRRLVTAGNDGNTFVWDARTGTRLFALESDANNVLSVTFSRDSRRIVTAGEDGTVRVWDDAGRLERALRVGVKVFTAVISPDQQWIAIGIHGDWSEIWNLATGQRIHKLPHRVGGAFTFAWSSDSQRVVSAGWDMAARVWEASSGRLLAECQGHTFPIWSVALSPDGNRLATGSMDRTAKVWDTATGHELLTLAGHKDDVHSVAWSADGRQIVTGSDDQTLKIWEAANPEDVARWQAEDAEAARRLARSKLQDRTTEGKR